MASKPTMIKNQISIKKQIIWPVNVTALVDRAA
jgi:hypothetical protein